MYPEHDVFNATQATPSKVHPELYAAQVVKLYPVVISPQLGSLQFELPAVLDAQ